MFPTPFYVIDAHLFLWNKTEVDDGGRAGRRALNRLSTQTSVENVSADEMSSPVTSPDAPATSNNPKVLNENLVGDFDDLEDQSILPRCEITFIKKVIAPTFILILH